MVKDPSVSDSTWNNGYFFQVMSPEISSVPIILWYSVRKSSTSRKQDPTCLTQSQAHLVSLCVHHCPNEPNCGECVVCSRCLINASHDAI